MVIVGFVAAIKPSTYDMAKAINTDVTCGSLTLSMKAERDRFVF